MAVKPQSAQLYKDYPTTLEGQQTVEIRSKVTGYIDQILVDEGAYVKKGQLLFRLNANDLQATVRSSEAQVKVAEANVNTARINLEKTKPLVEKNIISKFDLASVEATLQASAAQLAQAKATWKTRRPPPIHTNYQSAEGKLEHSPTVWEPGKQHIVRTTDNLFEHNKNVCLLFVQRERLFSPDQRTRRQEPSGKFSKLPDVSLIMADNSVYEMPGRIETASGLVNQQTGSVNVRATFPNPEGILRSGASGLVRIPQYVDSVIVIPQKTTYELQGKHFVYVVGSDNKVHNTEIEVLIGNLKDNYVVTSGLNPGDQIVLEGIASLRNDTESNPSWLIRPQRC
jgi:membrane fusion protein (multidrug efflux system)